MNTVLAAAPRMLQGMANQGQAFPQLKATNRFDAPWVAIVMLSVLTTIPFITLGIESLITLIIAATTSWLLAYCVAHIDVMVLRKRLPDLRVGFCQGRAVQFAPSQTVCLALLIS